MNYESIVLLALIAMASSAISLTTSKAVVFEAVRERIKAKSKFFGELANCPYCTSHWVSFAFIAVYQPVLTGNFWADLVVGAFAVVTLASWFSGLTYKAIDVIGEGGK